MIWAVSPNSFRSQNGSARTPKHRHTHTSIHTHTPLAKVVRGPLFSLEYSFCMVTIDIHRHDDLACLLLMRVH